MNKFVGLVALFTCLCFDASVNAIQCSLGLRGMLGGQQMDEVTNIECPDSSHVCVRADLEATYQGQTGKNQLQSKPILWPMHFVQNSERTSIFFFFVSF